MSIAKHILLATGNQHKVREFNDLADTLKVDATFIDLKSAGYQALIEETGFSYLQNARLKAKDAFEQSGIPSLADDSGLEVISLDNLPGLYSARYAGVQATDSENRNKLLEAMKDDQRRTARFICALCYIDSQTEIYFLGITPGRIANKESGKDGFGYDPLFIPAGYTATFADMYAEEKNLISHRGKAMQAFSQWYHHYNK